MIDRIDQIFPPWLSTLRAAGYRLENIPRHRRDAVKVELTKRGVKLLTDQRAS